jgi:hypothetical protein
MSKNMDELELNCQEMLFKDSEGWHVIAVFSEILHGEQRRGRQPGGPLSVHLQPLHQNPHSLEQNDSKDCFTRNLCAKLLNQQKLRCPSQTD